MKIAEALMLRSDLESRLQALRGRLEVSIKVQQGDEPVERPEALFGEADQLLTRWSGLVHDINRTNAVTRLADGPSMTITQALAERERLSRLANVYRAAIQQGRIRQPRFGVNEVRFVTTVDLTELQAQVDELASRHQALDVAIQRTNWQADLVEDEAS
jgi:hypothetical protein